MKPVAGNASSLSPNLNPLSPSDNLLSDKMTPGKRLPMIDRNAVDPDLRAGAEGMETMFLDFLMKTMRDTVPQSEFSLDSPGGKIYTSMLDSEMAHTAAKAGGVGLADQIIAFMESQRYNYSGATKSVAPQEQEALKPKE